MYEQYRDKAAFEEHGASEHFKTLGLGELFPLMEERRREIYETLD
jgi:quinol monooxygenase YgiN